MTYIYANITQLLQGFADNKITMMTVAPSFKVSSPAQNLALSLSRTISGFTQPQTRAAQELVVPPLFVSDFQGNPRLHNFGQYMGTNERDTIRFTRKMPAKKGWYMGVAGLQNYNLMRGHDTAVLVDIDYHLVLLHAMMAQAFLVCDTKEEFVSDLLMLTPRDYEGVLTQVAEKSGFVDERFSLWVFKKFIDNLKDFIKHELSKPDSFLSNEKHFKEVKAMFTEGRVVPVWADIYDARFISAVKNAAAISREKLTTIYLSNSVEWVDQSQRDVFFNNPLEISGKLFFTTAHQSFKTSTDGFSYHTIDLS